MGKKKNIAPVEGSNEILLYTKPNGNVKVEIFLQNETSGSRSKGLPTCLALTERLSPGTLAIFSGKRN